MGNAIVQERERERERERQTDRQSETERDGHIKGKIEIPSF